MQTEIDEIAPDIYRLSTYVEAADFTFNQYIVKAKQPLLFHCGTRALFASVSAAMSTLMAPSELRWISFGHHEADESGAMNDWLTVAPQATVAVGEIGCMLSANDLAARPPRALRNDETLDLGGRRARFVATPHVPHCWDAGLLFEETTSTLLCGDLFTRIGRSPARSDADPLGPALAAEDVFGATALTPATAPTLRRLATLAPTTLSLMHGPAYDGDCVAALEGLADAYADRLTSA